MSSSKKRKKNMYSGNIPEKNAKKGASNANKGCLRLLILLVILVALSYFIFSQTIK